MNRSDLSSELRNEELEKVYGGMDPSEIRFAVYLEETGPSLSGLVRVIKELNGIGLKEAKEIVDSAPSLVAENLTEDQALVYKSRMEATGARVTML